MGANTVINEHADLNQLDLKETVCLEIDYFVSSSNYTMARSPMKISFF